MNSSQELFQQIDSFIDATEARFKRVLRDLIGVQSVSGNEKPLVNLLQTWCESEGMLVDRFETDEAELAKYPQSKFKHLPLVGRPTLVAVLKGSENSTSASSSHPGPRTLKPYSLIFNAHTDVVGVPDESAWSHGAWSGAEIDGKFFGRGACDIKGSIVSALWAMVAVKSITTLAGDVGIEFIPGEEDCVGLGTLTSVVRGHQAGAVIVLEPTESMPRPASRGAVRFDITLKGKSVHGTVKWLGQDAIQLSRKVLDVLAEMEKQFNDRDADELFAAYPIARPITVDTVHAGQWQGMVADRATVGGYFELLPNDGLSIWKEKFTSTLIARLKSLNEPDVQSRIEIRFSEEYTGHRVAANNPAQAMLALAEDATQPVDSFVWSGFNSGCEAGLRATMFGTPTLVWGPGSLAQAHSVDEFVEWSQVKDCARRFARFMIAWSNHAERA